MYDDESTRPRTSLILVLLAVGALVLGALFFLQASKPERTAAPTKYARFIAPDRSFVCEAPAGWDKKSAGAHGIMSGALFTNGKAKIDITSDLQGSLMGDIARATSAQSEGMAGSLPPGMALANLPQERAPVEQLHQAGKKPLAATMQNYAELPMQPLQSRLGEARFSEWTGDAGLMGGGKMRGYRVTILGGERRVTVLCQCAEPDWKTLKPAFARIIRGIGPGGG